MLCFSFVGSFIFSVVWFLLKKSYTKYRDVHVNYLVSFNPCTEFSCCFFVFVHYITKNVIPLISSRFHFGYALIWRWDFLHRYMYRYAHTNTTFHMNHKQNRSAKMQTSQFVCLWLDSSVAHI